MRDRIYSFVELNALVGASPAGFHTRPVTEKVYRSTHGLMPSLVRPRLPECHWRGTPTLRGQWFGCQSCAAWHVLPDHEMFNAPHNEIYYRGHVPQTTEQTDMSETNGKWVIWKVSSLNNAFPTRAAAIAEAKRRVQGQTTCAGSGETFMVLKADSKVGPRPMDVAVTKL